MSRLLTSPETAARLLFGLVALAVGLVAILRRGRPAAAVPVVGLLFAAAVALGLRQTLGLPGPLALGLTLLAAAGLVGGLPVGRWLAPTLAVPGAWLVAASSGLADGRLRVLVGAAVVAGGFLLAEFEARWGSRGLGPPLLAISVAGVYATVPDTEAAMVALGVALPLALLGWPWPIGSIGRTGAYAATGALLWVVAAGGVGRGSAVVGGIACLGLLAVEPAARLIAPGRRSVLEPLPNGRWGAAAAGVVHLGLVYVAARVAGLRSTVAEAAVIASVELAAAVVLAVAATARRDRGGRFVQ